MIREEREGLPILRFPSLEQAGGLIHGVSTRQGGVSTGPFHSLNLAGDQDQPQAVAENRRRLARALGLDRLVSVRQVHGTRLVDAEEAGEDTEADGLVTTRPGLGLLIKQADCQAVILAAPGQGVVANLHVGWRGNVRNLPGLGVEHLHRHYRVEPSRLWAAISPSLGPCCAEFVNHRQELPPEFARYRVAGDNFDLWQITWDQLCQAGVRPERIETAGLCTRCDRRFFSYRREGRTGRFGTVVALAGREG